MTLIEAQKRIIMTHPSEDTVAQKLEQTRREIQRLENKIALLRTDENRFVITLEVMASFSNEGKPVQAAEPGADGSKHFQKKSALKRKRSKGTPRPRNIPTTPEMITQAIQAARMAGISKVTNRDIVNQIDSLWWPGVDPNYLIPTAWRMVNEERLKKVGEFYFLPDEKTAIGKN